MAKKDEFFPVVGDRFTHMWLKDPDWRPSEGQRWSDTRYPRAEMQVTSVKGKHIFFTYAKNLRIPHDFYSTLVDFDDRYREEVLLSRFDKEIGG